MSRCDATCKYPCARDHRTKAEKIAAMAAGATTPGERAAAEAAAKRHPVKEQPVKKPTYVSPRHTYSSSASRVHWWVEFTRDSPDASSFGPNSRTYKTPTPKEAKPAGAKSSYRSYNDILEEEQRHTDALAQELLRRAREDETVRFGQNHTQTKEEFERIREYLSGMDTEALREAFQKGTINRNKSQFEEE